MASAAAPGMNKRETDSEDHAESNIAKCRVHVSQRESDHEDPDRNDRGVNEPLDLLAFFSAGAAQSQDERHDSDHEQSNITTKVGRQTFQRGNTANGIGNMRQPRREPHGGGIRR